MKKGFTLIELIAVIAIVAVISVIAGVSYSKISNEHKAQACENLKKRLMTATIDYVQDNSLFYKKNTYTIDELIVGEIIDLSDDDINEVSKKSFDEIREYEIEITRDSRGVYKAAFKDNVDICE